MSSAGHVITASTRCENGEYNSAAQHAKANPMPMRGCNKKGENAQIKSNR